MKVLIAVPTYDKRIDANCFKSIYGLDKGTHTVQFDFVSGYDVARARTMIAQEALDYQFDAVLMVDSDMILQSDTLVKLAALNVPITLAWYHRRQIDTDCSELFSLDAQNFEDKNNYRCSYLQSLKEPISVKGGGLGCALIHTSVFRSITKPWFQFYDYNTCEGDEPQQVLSEDTFFCAKCTVVGYSIMCDPTVRAWHICSLML